MLKTIFVLSPICQIRFSNLPGFNRLFLPVEIGDFLQKASLGNPPKNERKQQAKFPFILLPRNNDSWVFSCILSSCENEILLNKLSTLGRRLFIPPKREHVLKCAESHRCEINTLGTLLVILARFLGFLKGVNFRKLLVDSGQRDGC